MCTKHMGEECVSHVVVDMCPSLVKNSSILVPKFLLHTTTFMYMLLNLLPIDLTAFCLHYFIKLYIVDHCVYVWEYVTVFGCVFVCCV